MKFLFICIFVFVVSFSCTQEDMILEIPSNNKEVEVVFDLMTQPMEEVVTSDMSQTRYSDEILDVSFSSSDEVLLTRAVNSLTPAEEAAVKTISYFEFSGTVGTSTCVKKGTATFNTTNNKASLTLTTSNTVRTVYFIVNLGDVTGSVANNITLNDFKNLTYTFANDANVATTGLPMAGFANTTSGHNGGTVTLQRLVAKVRFICNVNVPSGESFTFTSMRLVNAPRLGAYATKASYPPNNVAGNFMSYSAVTSTDQVWYIPENRRGAVTNSDPKRKNSLAPAYSTHVEIQGAYVKGGVIYENTYRIYLGANATNNFELLGNRNYLIKATIKGFDILDGRIYVIENLSSKGTANCYIALRKNTGYKFNAKVMGNGRTTPAFSATFTIGTTPYTQNAPAIVPRTLSPTKVILIWETGSSAGQVIKPGSLSLTSNGFVRFDTADNDTEGNALIGVTDNANKVLWSWHIWKTTYDPNTLYDVYVNKEGYTFNVMKHSLGATATGSRWNSSVANGGELGLSYQWGRKDPFVGGVGWNQSTTVRMPTVTHASHPWRDGDDDLSIPNTGPVNETFADAGASIAYAILHPTHFIMEGWNDWLKSTNYSDRRDNLWGNPNSGEIPNVNHGQKSIYDPCPLGWRAPRSDTFTGFIKPDLRSTNDVNDLNVVSTNFVRGWFFYLNANGSGATSYYPTPGYRFRTTGKINLLGVEGNSWTASAAGSQAPPSAIYLYISSGSNKARVIQPVSRAHAFPLRCAKE